jgi:transcriptional regulator with XRE-family HTH domain
MKPRVPAATKAKQLAERVRIGANIKNARAQAGLSLRDLERLAHVGANHLSEVERGLRSATVDSLVLIAIGLSTTLSRLVGGSATVASPAAESLSAAKSPDSSDQIGR